MAAEEAAETAERIKSIWEFCLESGICGERVVASRGEPRSLTGRVRDG